MRIVSSKRINFLVKNIFEKYYEPIQEELSEAGVVEELSYKIKQEILEIICRRAMDEGIETEEELDKIAVAVINERLESVLVPYYVKKYVDSVSLDKVELEHDMLKKNAVYRQERVKQQVVEEVVEDKLGQELQESYEVDTDKAENIEDWRYDDDFNDVEIVDLSNERADTPVVRRIEEPRIRGYRINWKLTIIASLLVTIVLWFVVGMLMGRGYLPRVDCGYTWFNSHIWSVF